MAEQRLSGIPTAPGLAQGAVSVVLPRCELGIAAPGTPGEERAALLSALERARAAVERQAARSAGEAADMLGFQAAMLADEVLARPALAAIAAGTPAADAWDEAIAAEAACYAAGGGMLAARAADLNDIAACVRSHLLPGCERPLPPPGAVVAASDLPLSGFLGMDWSQGGAIVLTEGSPASHVAMLARARDVPMVVGTGVHAQALSGCWALVDAAAGTIVLDPSPAARASFSARVAAAARTGAPAAPPYPSVTRDGTPIAVTLTVGSATDLDGLDPAASDGIGLVRTELLFHGDGGVPSEEAQHAAYRRILEWAGRRAVAIRLLDMGGDKPAPGMTGYGLRGIRLLLHHRGLLRTQLRALARAAAHGNLSVLLPLVTVPEELRATRALLDECVRDLERERVPVRRPPLGIMVEVPAAALGIEQFEADFYSIGASDLTAHVTATGRHDGRVSHLADPLNPAVLRLVSDVARHGRAVGRAVSLCGDAASDPRCIGPMLRAGVRSISVPPNAQARARAAAAAVDLREGAP